MFEEFKKAGRMMYESGLAGPGSGAMSVRNGDKVLITRAGANFAELSGEDLVEVPLEGRSENDGLASKDLSVHRALYKSTQAKAVAVAVSPSVVAVSLIENRIVPQDSTGVSFFRSAPIVRVGTPVSFDDVVRIAPTLISDSPGAFAVKGFGSYSFGPSLMEAVKISFAVDTSCSVLIATRTAQQAQQKKEHPKRDQRTMQRSAIPPGIGVMDRSDRRRYRR